MTTATQTTTDTATRTENRRLVLRAFAALTAGAAIDSSFAVRRLTPSSPAPAAASGPPQARRTRTASARARASRSSASAPRTSGVLTQATVRAPSGRLRPCAVRARGRRRAASRRSRASLSWS